MNSRTNRVVFWAPEVETNPVGDLSKAPSNLNRSSYQANLRTSVANRQADHTQQTSNLHYRVSLGPSSTLNLSDADVDRFIEVSEAWQAILDLVPGSRIILDCLYGVLQYKKSVY